MNDIIFNKAVHVQFLQVIHKVTYWINAWPHHLHEDQQLHMDSGFDVVIRAIFNQDSW
jgi:hypothetical protein